MDRRTLIGTAALAATPWAWAQQAWPTKPVRVIVPYGPGQGPEVLLRLVADKLQTAWGQPVVVENKPGAGGFIAFEAAKQAPTDGTTLVAMDSFHIGTHPHLFKKRPYDAFKDFEPITPLIRNYFFIVVPTDSPWQNVADLISDAKRKPGGLSYGSWGVATPAHLGGALLESTADIKLLHVPFKNPGELYQSVATRLVDFSYASPISAKGMLDAGKVRLLAVAAPKRTSGYEQIPTVAEARGPSGFELGGWAGVLAPAGTPAAVVAKVNEGIRAALATPDIRGRLAGFTYEDFTMSPAEMRKTMEREVNAWGPVIASAGIKLD
jgi:tripartite-type tricarboxylate transporter receptor subunit TctC